MSPAFIDILWIVNTLLLIFALAWALSRQWGLPTRVLLIMFGILGAQLDSFEIITPLLHQEWFSQMIWFLIVPTLIFNAALKLEVRQWQEEALAGSSS